MAAASDDSLDIARRVASNLAGDVLPASFAKLYSQHTRLKASRESLPSWTSAEAEARLRDALLLLDAAFVQRENEESSWSAAALRAAELLEWLAHPQTNQSRRPLHLLASAAYQLAGYPARSSSLLTEATDQEDSRLLSALLRADFPSLISELAAYWQRRPSLRTAASHPTSAEAASAADVRQLVLDETAGALGVLAAFVRWGDEDRLEAAVAKTRSVAQVLLRNSDPYGWLLAKLSAEVADTVSRTALRRHLAWLPGRLNDAGGVAIERYLRLAYQRRQSLAWPSQARGIARLATEQSFVLCTPTGSGKTTVAELAIIQSLFKKGGWDEASEESAAPLAIYLVPSRALAAEVEARLCRVVSRLTDERVVVTGLYGGTDWGPTDAWLTREERTVLICTCEKAEALLRFLGPLFLHRLSLVVLDEAHAVQFDGNDSALARAGSRSLRVEALISRLLSTMPADARVIALSAVAAGLENALARWVTGGKEEQAERTLYRSTRQLIGRLECNSNRGFEIRYELLDRSRLRYDARDPTAVPFVPSPFPPHPSCPRLEQAGPEKRLRPHLFWAAMNLVSPGGSKPQHTVLISITQGPGGFADDLLDLIDHDWAKEKLPVVFVPPGDQERRHTWERCLRICADYFGQASREYRLLEKGIILHHGKMPGLLARLLIQLVQDRVVHLILATSTLSEGVNLPFETVLVPSLRRRNKPISAREFANLAGRAGRPGFGTEGRTLVLMRPDGNAYDRVRLDFNEIVGQLTIRTNTTGDGGVSPLARLLRLIEELWQRTSASPARSEFVKWLEQTSPVVDDDAGETDGADGVDRELVGAVDTLDSFLLSAIVEVEGLNAAPLSPAELEDHLRKLWGRCFAFYAANNADDLQQTLLVRGRAILTTVYPDAKDRERYYRSGLSPRSANRMVQLYPAITEHLKSGFDYAARDVPERFAYVERLVQLLSQHPDFRMSTGGRKPDWRPCLRWWVDPTGSQLRPTPKQISEWYEYIASDFQYRFAWGLGSVMALAINEAHGGVLRATSLEDWQSTGLPWAAFWLKDLLTWGTLDPVVSFLLARGGYTTRGEANAVAVDYYDEFASLTPDEQLDPRRVREWVQSHRAPPEGSVSVAASQRLAFDAELLRDFSRQTRTSWKVFPVGRDGKVYWVDLAGYALARSETFDGWDSARAEADDYLLDSRVGLVVSMPYV